MPQPEDPAPGTRQGEEHTPVYLRRADHWILPFFTDSTLWPVLTVAVLSLATIGAAILLLAVGARNIFALAALVVLAWISADGLRPDLRRHRLGPVSGLIVAVWLGSALAAVAAVALGLV